MAIAGKRATVRDAGRQDADGGAARGGERVRTVSGTSSLIFAVDAADAPLAAWNRLADRAIEPNPFFRPEFLRPLAARLDRREIRVVAIRREADGAFLALAPFSRRRVGLLTPAAVAHAGDYGPLGTPLFAPEADAATAASLCAAAAEALGTGLVAFPYLRTDGPVAALLSGMAATRDGNGPRLALCGARLRAGHATGIEGAAQQRAVSRHRVKELDRQMRRLADLGAVSITRADTVETLPEAIEAFLELEAAGWKGRAGTALVADPGRAAFARDFLEASARAGRLRIDALRLDGRPVAMTAMLRDGARAWSWKTAFDEAHGRLSPGSQIARIAMRHTLASDGIVDADSLAIPGHSMIEPLWPGRVAYATGLVAGGRFADLRLWLGGADLALEHRARAVVKALLRRR